MLYQEHENNVLMHKVAHTINAMNAQAAVDKCSNDLQILITNHESKEVAIWLTVLENTLHKLFNSVRGVQDAVTEEETNVNTEIVDQKT